MAWHFGSASVLLLRWPTETDLADLGYNDIGLSCCKAMARIRELVTSWLRHHHFFRSTGIALRGIIMQVRLPVPSRSSIVKSLQPACKRHPNHRDLHCSKLAKPSTSHHYHVYGQFPHGRGTRQCSIIRSQEKTLSHGRVVTISNLRHNDLSYYLAAPAIL
jgi:hypothetical protein